jgi:hypothetical protein
MCKKIFIYYLTIPLKESYPPFSQKQFNVFFDMDVCSANIKWKFDYYCDKIFTYFREENKI